MMRAPSAALQIDFHIHGARRLALELQHRLAEVRSRGRVPEARMQHRQRAAVAQAQTFALEPLVKPDGLQQFLRRGFLRVVQYRHQSAADAPFGVAIGMK